MFVDFVIIDQNVLSPCDTVSLTFNQVTLKSMVSLYYPGWICGPSLRRVRSRCYLVIDWKRKVYRQTDGWIDMCKAICPLFRGALKNSYILHKLDKKLFYFSAPH